VQGNHRQKYAVLAFKGNCVYSSLSPLSQADNPMTIKFKNSSEAFLSVLSLVIGADSVGSLEERDFLFEKVKNLPLFGNPSVAEFSKLLGQVTSAVYSSVSTKDGDIAPEGVSAVLTEAKKLLNPEQQKSLVKIATELSTSDGTAAEEVALLTQLRRVFG
jgi:hypothetical protein